MRDCRKNTVHLSKYDSYLPKNKTTISNLHKLNINTNNNMETNFCIQTTLQKSLNIG